MRTEPTRPRIDFGRAGGRVASVGQSQDNRHAVVMPSGRPSGQAFSDEIYLLSAVVCHSLSLLSLFYRLQHPSPAVTLRYVSAQNCRSPPPVSSFVNLCKLAHLLASNTRQLTPFSHLHLRYCCDTAISQTMTVHSVISLTLWRPLLPYWYSYKHPVPDRVKPSYCNFWHLGTLTLSAECQSAQMSKITNDGLTRSGTECFTAVPIRQQWASKD